MSIDFDNFNTKFRMEELLIIQTDYWRWSVRPIQCTVGAGVLSLKRPAKAMSELTEEEGADLIYIMKLVESALMRTFNYDKINYLMLMMIDFHIHFHVIPRYSRDIEFSGQIFKDLGWPKPPLLEAEPVSDKVLISIRDSLSNYC